MIVQSTNTVASVLGTAGIVLGCAIVQGVWVVEEAIAHQVEISGQVGATIHIEPNDTPRAGQSALTWFALTKRGGQVIPLSTCDCSLAIYNHPYEEGDRAIATPDLRAISAEGYNGIPGADIVFPSVGTYELVLTGKPLSSGTFDPFKLSFSVTVGR